MRFEDELPDDRPLVVYPYPFWRDRLERDTYEAAVAGSPRKVGETPLAYVARISKIVTDEQDAEAARLREATP